MIVTLTPEMIAEADLVGLTRQQDAARNGRKTTSTFGFERLLLGNRVGARGERAGKIVFDPIHWHKYDIGGPDLGSFIDVKATAYRPPWLKAEAGTVKPEYAYVLVGAADHPHYDVIGWIWGHELLTVPLTEPQAGRPAHVVTDTSPRLRPIHDLQRIVDICRQ